MVFFSGTNIINQSNIINYNMRYVIRPAFNSYASTISGCGNGCTDSVNFPGQCNYKGIDSPSCQAAKDIYNKKKPAGTIHAPTPPPSKPLPSRFPSTINQTTGGDKVKKLDAKVSGGVSGTPGQGGSVGTSISQQKGDIPSDSPPSSSPSNDNDSSSCPSGDCSGALDLQCQFNKIACPLANQFNIPQGLLLPGAIGIIILLTVVFIIR